MAATKVARTLSVGLNPSAMCRDQQCEWRSPESATTRQAAKEHAKQTGHAVTVQTVTRDVYEPVPA